METEAKERVILTICLLAILFLSSCAVSVSKQDTDNDQDTAYTETPIDTELTVYTDKNGDVAYIPIEFSVSDKSDEQTIQSGLVVIGSDGSEFVWIPTDLTVLAVRDYGSYPRSASWE